MDEWGKRQLRTSKLVRFCTEYLLNKSITSNNVYGLCKLTWITNSFDSKDGSYIWSTKLPALSDIFEEDFLQYDYKKISNIIADLTGTEVKDINDMIYNGTGYTNFYKAYRNSSKVWIQKNLNKIHPLISIGYNIKSDKEAEDIINVVSNLPRIPKGNGSPGDMSPQFLLTPLFFSLDKRLRFPLINGNKGVVKTLKKLNVNNQPLTAQFKAVVNIIGKGDIKTAIDVDRLGGDLPYFVGFDGKKPTRKKLKKKSDKILTLKDENDVTIIKKSLSIKSKRLHNTMTNLLTDELSSYELHEGNSNDNMFDVLVKNIDAKKSDLLIEVKSSADIANVRMAVGQLMDYARHLENYQNTYWAVFTPELPDANVIEYLQFHKFNLLWIENNEIYCDNKEFPFKFKKT